MTKYKPNGQVCGLVFRTVFSLSFERDRDTLVGNFLDFLVEDDTPATSEMECKF